MQECAAWGKTLSGKDHWQLKRGNELSSAWSAGAVAGSKSRRQEDGSDYFSVYAEGFSNYFAVRQQGEVAARPENTNIVAKCSAVPEPASKTAESNAPAKETK